MLVDDVVVGWTELEGGDPPMGVALGRLHPNDAYADVKPGSSFRVRAGGGEFLEPSAGVHVEDCSAELGADAIEISVLGLDSAIYEKYFTAHVRAYEDHWKSRDR
ncbi:MAG: hypothetical protein KF773_14130 [Deltaproteobacteria bacterium]|nr:hypothetical protein [Deltaproteobacteria bacterium]